VVTDLSVAPRRNGVGLSSGRRGKSQGAYQQEFAVS